MSVDGDRPGMPLAVEGYERFACQWRQAYEGSRSRFDSCHPSYVSALQGNTLEESTPEGGGL